MKSRYRVASLRALVVMARRVRDHMSRASELFACTASAEDGFQGATDAAMLTAGAVLDVLAAHSCSIGNGECMMPNVGQAGDGGVDLFWITKRGRFLVWVDGDGKSATCSWIAEGGDGVSFSCPLFSGDLDGIDPDLMERIAGIVSDSEVAP